MVRNIGRDNRHIARRFCGSTASPGVFATTGSASANAAHRNDISVRLGHPGFPETGNEYHEVFVLRRFRDEMLLNCYSEVGFMLN